MIKPNSWTKVAGHDEGCKQVLSHSRFETYFTYFIKFRTYRGPHGKQAELHMHIHQF